MLDILLLSNLELRLAESERAMERARMRQLARELTAGRGLRAGIASVIVRLGILVDGEAGRGAAAGTSRSADAMALREACIPGTWWSA